VESFYTLVYSMATLTLNSFTIIVRTLQIMLLLVTVLIASISNGKAKAISSLFFFSEMFSIPSPY